MKKLLAPSLMCMDLMNVEKQLKILDKYSDYYHVDIMDGHFVKNIGLSFNFIKQIKNISKVPLDCHLYLTNPEDYLDTLLELDIDILSFHAEVINGKAFKIIDKVKSNNKKIGIVLNPETSFSVIENYVEYIDLLNILTVEPGFAGQKFINKMLCKIDLANKYRKKYNLNYIISADGGCSIKTYENLLDVGTDMFVLGTASIFNNHLKLEDNIKKVRDDINLLLDDNKYIKDMIINE